MLETEHTVTRKELSAAARDAEKALRLSATQRIVLGQLVACWGEQKADRLLVWPSNAAIGGDHWPIRACDPQRYSHHD